MCGIAGFLSTPGARRLDEMKLIATRMGDRLRHRGPDAGDTWQDADAGVALSHRRLSIIDLSATGAQPMHSADGRWVIVFNGEIYNYLEMRSSLESAGSRFRGHSDTEVFLEAVSNWGLDRALNSANGMFAFGLWDARERRLHLIRDRIGEKPLYYSRIPGGWVFGSELKALRAHPAWRPELDRGALALFLRHGYIPAPWSIYQGVRKVMPGTIVSLANGVDPKEEAYWSAFEAYERGVRTPFGGTPGDARAKLDSILRESVRIRMHSDVPLGAFLSGGIDSTSIVALMQAQSLRPVKTFTIGFREDGFNEAAMAKAVAQHLGTDHTELYVTGEDARAVIPQLPELYDEPFSDSSQIPTFLVSRLARQQVTVALSGDGGDELFEGYPRYALVDHVWRMVSRVSPTFRALIAAGVRSVPSGLWNVLFSMLGPLLPARLSRLGSSFRRYQIAALIGVPGRQDFYRQFVSISHSPEQFVLGAEEPPTAFAGPIPNGLSSYVAELGYLDVMSYLPDDILVKVDRASMAVGLETRVPLLDHRMVEFAASLPDGLKKRDGKEKWLLRQVLHQYVPMQLVDRPKMGFGVPMGAWLQRPLKEWAQDLLSPASLAKGGFLAPAPVAERLAMHMAGREDAQALLWSVLVFQSWLQAGGLGAS